MPTTRRLAAILAADVAGYSRLIGADEEGTLLRLRSIRAEVIDPKIAEHNGRLVKTTGDGLLVEFSSVMDALRCATEIQQMMAGRNSGLDEAQRIDYRIGVHQGDIVVDGADILGDGVNVAARLEGLAQPGGICVSGRVQEDAAGKLDLDFRDLGEQNLKNITRPVRAFAVRLRTEAAKSSSAEPLPLPDKPSIAVLPFQNMSGDPEQEYFADGMVEEIITALSRIRWLFVIARNSSFTYKGKAVDVKQVARELGVRYVLEGSVRRAAGRVRITTQLIDAETGAHLWADHFEGSLEDVFYLQDEVAVGVAGIVEPTVKAAEIRRSVDQPTNSLTAYDLYLRALSHWYSHDKGSTVLALDLLGRAIEHDPRYGPALALAARCHHSLHANGTEEQETHRREGVDLVRRALLVAGDDADVLGNSAYILGYFGEDIDAAIALIDRAVSLNPSFAVGWQRSGWLRLWAGQSTVAINHFETAFRLNPRDHTGNPFMGIGVAHFLAGRFEEAKVMLIRSLQEYPNWAPTYRFLASCYAQMGRLDEARQVVERLRSITSVIVPTASHWRDTEQRELYLSGLRLAAGEAD